MDDKVQVHYTCLIDAILGTHLLGTQLAMPQDCNCGVMFEFAVTAAVVLAAVIAIAAVTVTVRYYHDCRYHRQCYYRYCYCYHAL